MQDLYSLNYLGLGLLGLAAFVVPLLPIVLARFVAPKLPSAIKNAPYECGVATSGNPWAQFRVQYYLYAMAFVIFDVEILFVYPWAVVFKQVGITAFFAVMVFILVLAFGLIYAWQRGALEWD